MMAAPWGARVHFPIGGMLLVALVVDQGRTHSEVKIEYMTTKGSRWIYVDAGSLTIIDRPYSHLPTGKRA